MDVYTYLKRENDRIFDRVETLTQADDNALRKMLLNPLSQQLPALMTCKGCTFYLALSDHAPDGPASLANLNLHHDTIRAALTDLGDAANDGWQAPAEHLRLAVLRHIDEEEREVFRIARRHLERQMAVDLARIMATVMATGELTAA